MADKQIAIKVTGVGKIFQPQSSSRTIKEAFISIGRRISGKRKLNHHLGEYEAFNDISFDVNKGDFFGIVGRNGSGKSTLLKILAGVYTPTKGSVQINGKLTPFIELGVGFNPELSGRDNVFLNGALLGFSRKQMLSMYNDIVAFAELYDFMDTKLKNYSSGMQVRLAFSIAIRAKSDILLIDEVLAVGDAAFQQKCFEYFRNLKENGQTVVLVSHDRSVIEQYCNRAVLIDDKNVVAIGKPSQIFDKYAEIVRVQIESDNSTETKKVKRSKRWGTGDAEITSIAINKKHKNNYIIEPLQKINIIFTIKSKKYIKSPVYGIVMRRKGESPIFVTNTILSKINTRDLADGDIGKVEICVENIFANGEYYLSPAIATYDGATIIDWRDDYVKITVINQDNTYAPINPRHLFKVT